MGPAKGPDRSDNESVERPSVRTSPDDLPPAFVEKRRKPRIQENPTGPPLPAKLGDYEHLLGKSGIEELRYLAQGLRGKSIKVVHASSLENHAGEMLNRSISLLTELEVVANFEAMVEDPEFRKVAHMIRRTLGGDAGYLAKEAKDLYLRRGDHFRERSRFNEDVVVVHDPEPLSLVRGKSSKNQYWVWRCHMDLSNPNEEIWKFLRPLVESHDAAVFSAQVFAYPLSIPEYLFYPCIDPLSERNKQLEPSYIQHVCEEFGIDRSRPVITQVSSFDRNQDPMGVIAAYRLAKKYVDCQLVLVGSIDTEGAAEPDVMAEVMDAANRDPDILVVNLPASSASEINALQSASRIIVQKSSRGGFGTTVTEALWKGKPVVASAVGGVPNQIIHKITGALVHSVEGFAYQIRYLLTHQELAEQLGKNGREHVQENFLLTSDVKRWLLLFQILLHLSRR
jgi:trehalose synthase